MKNYEPYPSRGQEEEILTRKPQVLNSLSGGLQRDPFRTGLTETSNTSMLILSFMASKTGM